MGWSNNSRKTFHDTRGSQEALQCLSIPIPKQRFFKKNRRIIITANEIDKYYAFYGVHIKSAANAKSVSVSKFARAGASTDWFLSLANFKQYVSDVSPDLVLLNIGTNDLLVRNKGVGQYYQELRKLTEIIQEASPLVKIVIVEPNAVDMYNRQSEQIDNFELYRQARVDVSREIVGCEYFDLPSVCGDYYFFEQHGYMQDAIHPNAEGKRYIANKIFDAYFKK